MGMLSGLSEAIDAAKEEQQTSLATEGLENKIVGGESFDLSTEDLRQDVPSQCGGGCGNPPPMPTPVQVKEGESGNVFTILLNQFDNPKSQIAISQLLASASENDTVIFNISAVGGFIYSVLALAAMIKASKAHTVGIFSMVDSIQSVIVWLACKEKRVAATPCMFIESIKYGNEGSVVDQLADSNSTAFMQKDLLNDIVKAGIMTEEEAAEFSKHETMFSLFGEPLIERLAKVQ